MAARPYTLILDIDDSIQYPSVFSLLRARSGNLGEQNAAGQEPWFLELMRAAPLAPWVPRYRAWIRGAAEAWYVSGRWPAQVAATVAWLATNGFPNADPRHVIPCSYADWPRYVADKAAAVRDIAKRVAGDVIVVDDKAEVLDACRAAHPALRCMLVVGGQLAVATA